MNNDLPIPVPVLVIMFLFTVGGAIGWYVAKADGAMVGAIAGAFIALIIFGNDMGTV